MLKLHGYWRSSASYRLRIALALKGIEAQHIPVNLRGKAQKSVEHLLLNPQGFVPVLILENGTKLTQSLAILHYLESAYPSPALLPENNILKAQILSACQIIASDVAPIQNLSVLNYLRTEYDQKEDAINHWVKHWIGNGFDALESISQHFSTLCLMTDKPTFFECCLIPQIYNARRFGLNMEKYSKLSAIDAHCRSISAFIDALPENQIDAPKGNDNGKQSL